MLRDLGPLERSYDAKVSPIVGAQASKLAARVGNSFGTLPGRLEDGGTCAGFSGGFCEECYADRLARHRTSVRTFLGRNTDRLTAANVLGVATITDLFGGMLDGYRAECGRRGITAPFRPYWSGDIRTTAEARAWRDAWQSSPDLSGWQYTRTLSAVRYLADLPNLTLYVSADRWNAAAVRRIVRTYPTVRVAAAAGTFEDARNVIVGRDRMVTCPENAGRLPIAVPTSGRRNIPLTVGQVGQGACIACSICTAGRADVAFSTSKA